MHTSNSNNTRSLNSLYRDPIIASVIIVALLFWYCLSYFIPISDNLLWPLNSPLLFILPVVVYPILEEVVFRGALLEYLQKKIPGLFFFYISKANLITTLLFTLLHFYYHPPLWAAAVFIPSLVFGFVKERYCHLLPAIFLHVFFNLGYVILFSNNN